jgi:hypothetical protein
MEEVIGSEYGPIKIEEVDTGVVDAVSRAIQFNFAEISWA